MLFEFAEEDEASLTELRSLIERLEHDLSVAETEMLLAGENDFRNAICTIHPGAGGTESQDWAEMLLRMYLKWAEQRGFKTEILEYQPGEEAGLKSVTFRVEGEYAYSSSFPKLMKISKLKSTKKICAWTPIVRPAPAAST